MAIVNLTLGRRIFYPSLLGKLATVAQLLTVGFVLLANYSGRGEAWLRPLFVATLALTVASALHYVYLASTRGPETLPAIRTIPTLCAIAPSAITIFSRSSKMTQAGYG